MDRLNLGSRTNDMVLSFVEGREGSVHVTLTPQDPLDWGFDSAGLQLSAVEVARLKHWAATGEALPAWGPGAPTP